MSRVLIVLIAELASAAIAIGWTATPSAGQASAPPLSTNEFGTPCAPLATPPAGSPVASPASSPLASPAATPGVVVVPGCVTTPATPAAAQPITVPVALAEMTITPAQTTFKVAQPYTFVVTNHGVTQHEMVIERRGAVDQPLDANGQEAEASDLDPGQTKTLVWTFTDPGAYQLACHVPGHYEAGMVTAITVTP